MASREQWKFGIFAVGLQMAISSKAPRERQKVIAIICSASGESRVSEDPPKTPCTLNKMSLLKTFALIIFSVRDKDVFCGCKFKISIGDESFIQIYWLSTTALCVRISFTSDVDT